MYYAPTGDDLSTAVSSLPGAGTAPAADAASSGFNWGSLFAGVGAGLSALTHPSATPAAVPGQTPPIMYQAPAKPFNMSAMLPYLAIGAAVLGGVLLLSTPKRSAPAAKSNPSRRRRRRRR